MLKTLKWVYRLGYKHAESKYYHALVRKLNQKEQDYDYLLAGETVDTHELDKAAVDKNRIRNLIEEVFKPEVYTYPESPQTYNRFDPNGEL